MHYLNDPAAVSMARPYKPGTPPPTAISPDSSCRYFVYRQDTAIRITYGDDRIAARLLNTSDEVCPNSFDSLEEAKAERMRWRERLHRK